MPNRVLIVDDDYKYSGLLGKLLLLSGFAILKAFDLTSSMEILNSEKIDAVILDLFLPDGNGADFTKVIKEQFPNLLIIILTGSMDIASCVRSIKNGAADYLVKGKDNDRIVQLLEQSTAQTEETSKPIITAINGKKIPQPVTGFENIIGNADSIKDAIKLAQKVAATDASVLLLGETGTGKELFANGIHLNSKRRNGPFIAVNCASFPKNLLETELFGYKAGAFTGAIKNKTGILEQADRGTLFLDEIGEMDADIQAKILRVLETNEFMPVGDTVSRRVDIRLISATHKDLPLEVKNGFFREDLFYRLNIFSIELPPLRSRKTDIILLAEYYLGIYSAKLDKPVKSMTDNFKNYLLNYQWKGNIRELKNLIERSVILAENDVLDEQILPYEIISAGIMETEKAATIFDLGVFEKKHIERVLIATKWNKPEAARLLNISLSTLYRKIEDYMLSVKN